jgi:hypothetical protein
VKIKTQRDAFFKDVLESFEKTTKDLKTLQAFSEAQKDALFKQTQIQTLEYKKFEEDWLVNIESFFSSLNHIIRNLKNALKYEDEILPIEKTRRTNPESIRHLIRNTRNIKEVSEDGSVVPERVLNILSEIDYGIYENRFIMTLIDRLHYYLLDRLNVIKQHIHGFEETKFKTESSFIVNNIDYRLNVDLVAVKDIDTVEIDTHNKRVYERTQEAHKIVSQMYRSDFMQTMKRYKKVKPPIMKTQIILRNPDFRNAYMLWLYLDQLHVLDYTLEQAIIDQSLTANYRNQINQILMTMFSSFYVNSGLRSGSLISDDPVIRREKPQKRDLNSYANNLSLEIPEYDLEPQLASQYYLDKAKEILADQFSKIKKTNDSLELSLKQVLLDQYSIADQVFNYHFELEQDDDVFGQLLSHTHAVKRYEEALRKYNVVKIAREVKQAGYKESLSLEKKWLNEALKLQKEALKHLARENNEEALKKTKEIEKDFSLKLAESYEKIAAEYKEKLEAEKLLIAKELEALERSYKDELEIFEAEQNKRVELALKQAELLKENKAKSYVKQEEESFDKQKKTLIIQKQKQVDSIQKKLKQNKEKIRERANKKIVSTKK